MKKNITTATPPERWTRTLRMDILHTNLVQDFNGFFRFLHIITPLAEYTTAYIPCIYCLLGEYIFPSTYYQNHNNSMIWFPDFFQDYDQGKVYANSTNLIRGNIRSFPVINFHLSHERNPVDFPLYWLVTGDPYGGLL